MPAAETHRRIAPDNNRQLSTDGRKPHNGTSLQQLQLILSKYATMGPLGAATKRPRENLGANKARLNSFDLAFKNNRF